MILDTQPAAKVVGRNIDDDEGAVGLGLMNKVDLFFIDYLLYCKYFF